MLVYACSPDQLLQPGDQIVIASSSLFPEEVDEAIITSMTFLDGNTRTRLELQSPLRYTHLGEVVAVPGETRVLDMRAEVAVLTRNVLITVGGVACIYGRAPAPHPTACWNEYHNLSYI